MIKGAFTIERGRGGRLPGVDTGLLIRAVRVGLSISEKTKAGLSGQPCGAALAIESYDVLDQVIRKMSGGAAFDQTIGATFGNAILDQTVGATFGNAVLDQAIRTTFGNAILDQTIGATFGDAILDQTIGATFGNAILDQTIGATFGNAILDQTVGATFGNAVLDQTIRATFGNAVLDQAIRTTFSNAAFDQAVRATFGDYRLGGGGGEYVGCQYGESEAEDELAFHGVLLQRCCGWVWSRWYALDFFRELHWHDGENRCH